ncbi:MAG: hypothetical protein CMJ83_02490 [Planctomycetes bacterium]|nr:hypothetical protein [Planctomycetota bacterium]
MQRNLGLVIALTGALLGWCGRSLVQEAPSKVAPKDWSFHHLDTVSAERLKTGRPYRQFIKRDTLTCGLYALKKGATDGQTPHAMDEVYYVSKGAASFTVGQGDDAETQKVKTGAVIFVKRGVPHRFKDISDDLEVLVFFSTAKAKKK